MRVAVFFIASALLVLGAQPPALAQKDAPGEQPPDPRDSVCPTIERAAQGNALPVDFFVRVIWQESRFRPDEIGPLTRHGTRAQGIAQFMPSTAAERGLLDPFNPVEALPKSAEFLAELRDQFGNLGLAAAAYNAGPQRVREFMAGSRGLPTETRNYVLAITGRTIDDWAKPAKEKPNEEKNGESHAEPAITGCHDLMALLGQLHGPLNEAMQQRIDLAAQYARVPSWCKHLNHPNKDVCGPIHQLEPATRTSSLARSKVRKF
jgi:Transglycosylase SLT domain